MLTTIICIVVVVVVVVTIIIIARSRGCLLRHLGQSAGRRGRRTQRGHWLPDSQLVDIISLIYYNIM